MKLVLDCRYTRLEHHDGISRYGARLAESLGRLARPAGHDVTMLISDERQLTMLPDLPWALVSGPTSLREASVARQVNKLKPDVVFTPMQTMGGAGRRYGLVKTLHDLIYYRNRTPPRDLNPAIRVLWRLYHLAWWPQRLLLNQADEVATVSETSKGIIEQHRLTRRPISVVRNAADPVAGVPVTRERPVTRDLLYMGSFMPYKNVETLALALHVLPGYRLHLLSKIGPADRRRLLDLAPAGALMVHNGVGDDEYAELLRTAFALVHASLDEGFGIPLIEAMAAGTPIVVSDIPIFREVGADAAGYFPAADPDAAAAAIRSLEDAAVWRAHSERGRQVAAGYDWDASAGVLLDVLERVAATRSAGSRRR
ncbi:MAG: glycosyltransferase family 1 protein [Schumannella sp.]|nr:glycosyltransferase family 1 protein [Schumannella sp.]